MNTVFENISPSRVWHYFEEILQIPRPSKKEEKIRKYLVDFAKTHKLNYQEDEIGNVVIYKPAFSGYERFPIVVLQSHIDMVCEKNSDSKHNFDTDPIVPKRDGNWIKAKDTTLGADDGIGVAAQLAILEADDIPHGPLEMLFTVDEETGLTGAKELNPDLIHGRILLNLDSEDEGELFIGCAGGKDTRAFLDYKLENIESTDYSAFQIKVSGLVGGHSGDDINKGRGNAVKIITRVLRHAANNFGLRISKLSGGNLRNAIAREAEAEVAIPKKHEKDFIKFMSEINQIIKAEWSINEPNLEISCNSFSINNKVINADLQKDLINVLYACPHGVIAMSPSIPNFVDTSTNLASIKMHDTYFEIGTSQRSSSESQKDDVVNMVECVFELANCKIEHDDGYPGWTPNPNSHILDVSRAAYKKLFGNEPKVLAIHAGLECGLLGAKFPGMDMISFGPTVKGAHSPDERIDIETVQKFWDLTLEILKNVAPVA